MERGKLEMELQEERKSRDQWIREQRMKIENSCTTKSFSDCRTNDSQVHLIYLKLSLHPYVNMNLHGIFCSTEQFTVFLFMLVNLIYFSHSSLYFLTIFSTRDQDFLDADLWKSTVTLVVVYLKEIFSNLLS